MGINWTVAGLVLDIIGFLIVFTYGGFSKGSATLALQSHEPSPHLRLFGAALVIVGFVLQIVGALAQ